MRPSPKALFVSFCLLLGSAACNDASEPDPGPVDVGQPPDEDTHTGPTDSGGPTPDADAADGEVPDGAEDASGPKPACYVGLPCDDDDPCTMDDACVAGVCAGTPYACDDGRECTENGCDGEGGCEFAVLMGWCLIGNNCREHGFTNPTNACQRCDTDENKIAWSNLAELAACEDGDPCTFGDWCTAKGECHKGLSATCDDENSCTQDACDPALGCTNTPVSGECDDGDKCTPSSVCSGGVCRSPAPQCDDDNPCTADTCLPEIGCEHVAIEGACEDGDACTADDQCQNGVCKSGPPASCDDETQCTDDKCDAVFGCYHELVPDPCCQGAEHLCDDGNPCTEDVCSSDGACQNIPVASACEDGDPCTAGDTCQAGECVSGPPNPCNDSNPCTQDSCNEASGCQHSPKLGACNDGIDCTTNDTCIDGVCVGDSSTCTCAPDFSPTVVKAIELLLGETGSPGDGLDVDENSATCAPAGDCTGGVDNSLAPLAALANENIVKEMKSGHIVLLLELIDPKTDGSPFTMALYAGKLAGGGCDFQKPGCNYKVEDVSLDEDCAPLVQLDNATIKGGKLVAGGPGYSFPMMIPLFGDVMLEITLFHGKVEADIQLQGTEVKSFVGVVGGAVPKQTFVTAIEYVPDGQLPVSKETIVQLLDLLITEDIDTDGNGGPDAASIGLHLKGVSGTIVGVD